MEYFFDLLNGQSGSLFVVIWPVLVHKGVIGTWPDSAYIEYLHHFSMWIKLFEFSLESFS
jgi:hypothetical protein